tara:strand:+ start:979 stop:1176 length:198 start_codon:yes stop_codon:yes gene_type:complete
VKQNKSPCIDQCEFAGPKKWCLGCGRTRKECREWRNLKPYDKATIEKQLKQRMAKMRKAGMLSDE